MNTTIRCDCGSKLIAKKELAGKTVRCPRCKAKIVVADQSDFVEPLLDNVELGAPALANLSSSYVTYTLPPKEVSKRKQQETVARRRPFAIAVTMATLATMLLIGFAVFKYVFHSPYIELELKRIEYLALYDRLRMPPPPGELHFLNPVQLQHGFGGNIGLWFTRDDSNGRYLLLELKVSKRYYESIKLNDVKLIVGDSEASPLRFLRESPDSLSIDHGGTLSKGTFPIGVSPPDFPDLDLVLFSQQKVLAYTTEPGFYEADIVYAEGRFLFARTRASAANYGRSKVEWGGQIEFAGEHEIVCKYNKAGIDVEWKPGSLSWYAENSVEVSGPMLSRYGRLICVFEMPPNESEARLRIGDGPETPVLVSR